MSDAGISQELLAALIVGVVAALRRAGMPGAFGGLAAVGLGAALGAGWALSEGLSGRSVLAASSEGVLLGLAAAGLYSGGKALLERGVGRSELRRRVGDRVP